MYKQKKSYHGNSKNRAANRSNQGQGTNGVGSDAVHRTDLEKEHTVLEMEEVKGTNVVVIEQEMTWKIPNYSLKKNYSVCFALNGGMKW